MKVLIKVGDRLVFIPKGYWDLDGAWR
jgi:hypothetical protein